MEEERQAVCAKCEKRHREEEFSQQFLHYKRNKEDGNHIVLFLFMNAAHLLCQKLYCIFVYIFHSDQQQITMTTARLSSPHNALHSLVV